jgi:hypothetical protein
LFKGLFCHTGNLGIFCRDYALCSFHQGDVATQIIVEAGKFHPYGSAANDQQAAGQAAGSHGFTGTPDQVAINIDIGQIAGPGASGKNNMVSSVLGDCFLATDIQSAFIRYRGGAVYYFDIVFLHQVGDATAKFAGYGAAVLH